MAQADSPLVRRVTSILDQRHRPVARHAWLVVAAGVLAVAVAAPGVLAAREEAPAPADRPDASVAPAASAPAPGAENRQIRRPPSPGAPLSARWQWALDEASRQRLRDFWVVYSFVTPTHAGDLMMSDTADGSFVSRGGRFVTDGNALSNQLDAIAPLDSRGAVVAMFHHVAPNVEGINRAGYRSPQLGFKFGSSPVFWLGHATEDDSFARVRELFDQVRPEELQTFLIELASLHPTTDRVLPFLEGLLVPSRSVEIRREAAEGFDHHHDPRSVAVLMRVARTDPDVEVRAEAAETIGEVQTPESIPALTELATTSPDERVRSEAAEAFADQPVDAALPALERLIATSTYDDVLGEAVEALGEIKDPRVLPLLVRTATTHKSQRAQQEAVETIGEVEDASAVTALVDIIWKHTDVVMQREAVETLGDRSPVPKAELRRVRKDHPREEVREEAQETLDDHR
jgi:HEAT repeat protein